jgi:hypothetical protein
VSDALLVTAWLAGPLAGDPPQLDSLLEFVVSLHHPRAVPGYKVDRRFPAPPQGAVPLPIARRTLGKYLVACASSPILAATEAEWVEYVNKRLSVEDAGLLDPRERRVVTTTNGWTKSYRLPLRCRRVAAVAWFAVGDRRSVRKTLKQVPAIGKKIADGYGTVREWVVEPTDRDLSWYAPTDAGPVLMRPLPVGDWLPAGLVGARLDYGAAVAPYWHRERYTEIVVPC